MKDNSIWKTMGLVAALLIAVPTTMGFSSSSDPVELEPVPAVPTGGGAGTWLLVLDSNPWGRTANQDALTSAGIAFDQVSSDQLAATPLDIYEGVLIPSVQNPAYYDNLDANAEKLSHYVALGGLLVAHATQQSFTGGADAFLPGCTSYTHSFNDFATIMDPDSPIVDGVPESALQGWFYTAHGYLDDLPEVSNVVIENGAGNAIYASYPWGLGNVFVTGMTIEWVYRQGPPQSLVLDNEVTLDPLPDPLGGLTNLLASAC